MIAMRIRQLLLLAMACLLGVLAYVQVYERVGISLPTLQVMMMVLIGVLTVLVWGILVYWQRYASQVLLACVLVLTFIGITMIARIDLAKNTSVAVRQMIWVLVALVCVALIAIVIRDYRVLRRFSYVSMVLGLVLLLSPMIPGLGKDIGGARVWIGLGGYTVQPSEFAKLFLACFFAAYLFDHRDRLTVGARRICGVTLPRVSDLGPIVIVWAVSMGVLVLQRDLGTSLMFFAMFISMLYVATGRKAWLLIGFVAFALSCVVAAHIFAHVGYRVDAWLHPFDSQVYARNPGGSQQIVLGIFGLASGGVLGTGLGNGYPQLTPLSNSDFIYASVGEELGLTGLFALLTLYLVIIVSGLVTAMKLKDGFGKLLAAGLVFTMAFQVFTVVGGITFVIPLTGLTLPYMAAGGSSLVANYVLAAFLLIMSHSAHKADMPLRREVSVL